VNATGVAINAIGGPLGLEFIMRFTYEWVDVVKETFTADISERTGSSVLTVTASPQFIQTPMYKIEEVAVRMPTEAAASFVSALLTQFSQVQDPLKLTEQQRQRILDAFDIFQNT